MNHDNLDSYYFKRYFAKSNSGTDLYFIELTDLGGIKYYFSSSIDTCQLNLPEIEKLVNFIVNKIITENTREKIIQKLFIQINQLPGISRYYFKKNQLNKFGIFDESSYKLSLEQIEKFHPKLLTPYSQFTNSFEFQIVKDNSTSDEDSTSSIELTKKEFESKLKISFELQYAYTEVFSTDNVVYYFEQVYLDSGPANAYLMFERNNLIFFFLCQDE